MSRVLRSLLPALALVAALGCGGKPSDTKPATEPAPTPASAAKPAADPNAPSGERTLTYWQAAGKAQELTARKYAALTDPKPDVVSKLLADAAKAIDELQTEKVDPEAVAVGKGVADELRQRAEAKAPTPDAAGKARTAKASLSSRYGREFPDLTAGDKEPAFRIARDLARPTLAQELARLKGQAAKLDMEIKPVSDKLNEETFSRDKLQGEADSLRAILKDQKEDADLKKVREEVLADAVKDLAAKKVEIDALTKQLNGLRAKKSEYDRLAMEATGLLAEGEPEKTEKMALDRLDRLRVHADKLYDKLTAQKK